MATAQMIQTSPASRTSTSGRTRDARGDVGPRPAAACGAPGRRQMPSSGANSAGMHHEEEGQPGLGVGAGERLHPHRQHQQHHRVAEHRRGRDAGEQAREARLRGRPAVIARPPAVGSPRSRTAGTPHATSSHSRDPGPAPGSSCRSSPAWDRSRTAALISASSSAVSQRVDWSAAADSAPGAGPSRAPARASAEPGRPRARAAPGSSASPALQLAGDASTSFQRHADRADLPRPLPAGAAAGLLDEPVLGQLAQVPRAVGRRLVEPVPSSVAVSGPSTVSCSMIPSRTGWARARSSRGSVRRRWVGLHVVETTLSKLSFQ